VQATSFAVETTLAGKLHLRIAEKAKDGGWRIGLIYIGLTNADLAIMRVKERVANGGHNVPPGDVRRRYGRSLDNLRLMLKLADHAIVLDNSSTRDPMKLVVEAAGGQIRSKIRRLPAWLRAPISALPPSRRS
jgi:predicted ABC-type ATPase